MIRNSPIGSALFTALTGFIIGAGASGCSNQGTATTSSAEAGLSVHDLYKQLTQISAADRAERIAAVSKLPVLDYYQRLSQVTSNAPVEINGYTMSGLRDQVRSAMPNLASSTAQYATIGALWKAQGFDSKAALSEDQFTSNLNALLDARSNSQPSLGLTGDPWDMPTAADCTKAATVSPDLTTADANSLFWQSAPGSNTPGTVVLNPSGGGLLNQYLAAFDETLKDVNERTESYYHDNSTASSSASKKLASGTDLTRSTEYNPDGGVQSITYAVRSPYNGGDSDNQKKETIKIYPNGTFDRQSVVKSNVCGVTPS